MSGCQFTPAEIDDPKLISKRKVCLRLVHRWHSFRFVLCGSLFLFTVINSMWTLDSRKVAHTSESMCFVVQAWRSEYSSCSCCGFLLVVAGSLSLNFYLNF